MSRQTRSLIAVIGGGDADEATRRLAYEVGFELGRQGASLVCGGLGGVMAAASEGLVRAREEHGTQSIAVGLLPGEQADQANPDIDIALPTGLGIGRNLLVVRAATAVIAINGSSGTLSEMAFAWQLGRPLVALVEGGGWAARLAGQSIDRRRDDVVIGAVDPVDAVRLAIEKGGLTAPLGTDR